MIEWLKGRVHAVTLCAMIVPAPTQVDDASTKETFRVVGNVSVDLTGDGRADHVELRRYADRLELIERFGYDVEHDFGSGSLVERRYVQRTLHVSPADRLAGFLIYDLDGDGDPDIFFHQVSKFKSSFAHTVIYEPVFLLNEGGGSFSRARDNYGRPEA